MNRVIYGTHNEDLKTEKEMLAHYAPIYKRLRRRGPPPEPPAPLAPVPERPARASPPTVREIYSTVCTFYGAHRDDVYSDKRSHSVAWLRHAGAYLCWRLTNKSSEVIGEIVGRDHTTIIAGRNRVIKLMKTDPVIIDDMLRLTKIIMEEPQYV